MTTSYIVSGVWKNQPMDYATVNIVKSVYPLDDFVKQITKSADNGTLVIINKNKANDLLAPIGIQPSQRSKIINLAKDSISQNSEKSSGNAKYSLSEDFDIEQILFDDDFYSIYEKEDRSIINKSKVELQAELKAIDENYTDEDLVGEAKKRKLEDYKSNHQKYERLYEEQH